MTGSVSPSCDLHDRLFVIRARFFGDLLAGHEDHVAGREDFLVVFEDHELVALRRELRVGREENREVGLALFEDRVAEADVDRLERLELEPVELFEARQAVASLAALGRPVEGQVFGLAVEVGDLFQAQFVGGLLQRPDRVGAGEGRRRERRQAFLFEFGLRLFIGRLRFGGDVFRFEAEERLEGRAGVFGIAGDLSGLQRFQGDRFRAEAQVGLDLVAGRRQRLGVDLAGDFRFGEVLRADRQVHLAVGRVGDDRTPFAGFG